MTGKEKLNQNLSSIDAIFGDDKTIESSLGKMKISELKLMLKVHGKRCQLIKNTFPTVWYALKNQYKMETFPKVLSDDLFDKKLEVMILQDEELRGK